MKSTIRIYADGATFRFANIVISMAAILNGLIAPTLFADDGAVTAGSPPLLRIWQADADGRPTLGFVNPGGEICVAPVFDSAYDFHEGLARVLRDGQWSFLDSSGKVAFTLPKGVNAESDFSEGAAYVIRGGIPGFDDMYSGGTWGYIDRQGHAIGANQFTIETGEFPVRSFHQGRAGVNVSGKWGFVDSKIRIVIKPKYDKVGDFSSERAAVKSGKKWGYIDLSGQEVIATIYDAVGKFSESITPVTKDGHSFFIDIKGKTAFVLDGEWNDRSISSEGLIAVRVPDSGPVPPHYICPVCGRPGFGRNFGDPCLGCGEIISRPCWRFIDHHGNFPLSGHYRDIRPFHSGLAAVREFDGSGRWNFIDSTGRTVISSPCIDVPDGFVGDACFVVLPATKAGPKAVCAYLNRDGHVIWQEQIGTADIIGSE